MDNEVKFNHAEREKFVHEVLSNPRFSHGVFGSFSQNGGVGHYPHELRGTSRETLKRLFRDEKAYDKAFGRQTFYPEFKARVLYATSRDGEDVFILSFNDRQGDKRPASHTDYAIVIPRAEKDLPEIIQEDPTLLIDIFKNAYGKYDRSGGTLRLDEGFQIINLEFS